MPRERNNVLKPTLPSAPSAGRSPIGMHVSSTAAGCSLGVCKSGGDSALGDLVLAFEALGVDAEQDLDAVSCPFGDLGWGCSSVEPGGQACVAEVVRAMGEW
jgi:hypothetical protein